MILNLLIFDTVGDSKFILQVMVFWSSSPSDLWFLIKVDEGGTLLEVGFVILSHMQIPHRLKSRFALIS